MRIWVEWPGEDFSGTNTQEPRGNLIAEIATSELSGTWVPHFSRAFGARKPALSLSKGGSFITPAATRPLAELITGVTGRSGISLREDTSLHSDLGLSSLDRVELMSTLEERYLDHLSEIRFSDLQTVGDLERMLRDKSKSPPHYTERDQGRSPALYHFPSWTLR